MTPAGKNPAKRARSTAASVCPERLRTPPSLATKGNTCPGLFNSPAFVFGLTKACIVFDLSSADIPELTPCPFKSTETVKAVSIISVFFVTIGCNDSFLHLLDVIGTQTKPLPFLIIKLTISLVIICAGKTKSPSFSLFSSSTTIKTFPFLKSLIASEMVFNLIFIFLT